MPCYSPITGYRSKSRNESGKRSIVFNRSHGHADQPVTLPCGHCIGCRIDKSRMWAIRCVHESKLHDRSCFVTLTYDDDHLPADHGLSKRDLQLFFKKLRNNGFTFRYFASGEYGEIGRRPHYHVILFGIDFSADRVKHSVNQRGDILYTSPQLLEIWGNGHALIGSLNYSSAAYTSRYVLKKITGEQAGDHYTTLNPYTGEVFNVTPDFCLMSRNPGIGSGWYDKYKSDAFPSDFLIYEGKKHTVPRYYLNKLLQENENMHKSINVKRKKSLIHTKENNTPERLRVREECKLASIKQLKRNL